tara:strand:+ start:4006 stop:4233 length:228 start_codon:yes stop_codon:yes gene_type:complete
VAKLPDGDQKTAALDYISNTLSWIDNSHNATYEEKLKELQEKSQQLMAAMGSADAPDMADIANQPNTAPVVEEVD